MRRSHASLGSSLLTITAIFLAGPSSETLASGVGDQPEAAAPAPPLVTPIDLQAALAGRAATVALVKDFIKLDNASGSWRRDVDFQRYIAPSDDEQFVIARWVHARAHEGGDGQGMELPVEFMGIKPDPRGSPIAQIRLRIMPPQPVTVTITTVVVRREQPVNQAPDGASAWKITPPTELPSEVRPYLASTPMVDALHPDVRALADRLLDKTRDPYRIAAEIAALAKDRPYIPSRPDPSLPVSASVLKTGGSCCASAVSAAAVLRACGIPAQVTYCPAPSYVHGIVRFWVQENSADPSQPTERGHQHPPPRGHWIRMDATSGTGLLPFIQTADTLSYVRIYDTPIEMEQNAMAYAWPWHHFELVDPYQFRTAGSPAPEITMWQGDGQRLPFVDAPFPHLEPGSWSAPLGTISLRSEDQPAAQPAPEPALTPALRIDQWDDLVQASCQSMGTTMVGEFADVLALAPSLAPYTAVARSWGMPPANKAIEKSWSP